MKFFEVVLEERNGEQEYSHRVVVKAKTIESAEKKAERIARHWYEGMYDSRDGNTYYFDSGCLAVKVDSIEETNPQRFFEKAYYVKERI